MARWAGKEKERRSMMVFKKEYHWKDRSYGVDAQTAGEVMERIEKRDGILTKESFLEESRPEDSPTHKCFEWDDTVAAEKWRLNQSRHIINGLVVKVVKVDGDEERAPAYVNVSMRDSHTDARYKNLHVVMDKKEERQQVLKNALYELNTFRRKYAMWQELNGVFEAIRVAERELSLY